METEKVVKCKNDKCGLHFGYSEKQTKCPFCHTEYIYNKVKEKSADEEKPTVQKGTAKTQKESFKMWKDS